MLEEISEIQENNMTYYVIPAGYPLFKATKKYDIHSGNLLHLDPNGFYFFGIKKTNPEYIESYEELYGIIFEFVTTREYKLLALDKKDTQRQIYQNAPANIKTILKENYGYDNDLRLSEPEPDRSLAQYLCQGDYGGYGIKHMATAFRGSFHPEFMFCNIDGIQCIGRITTDLRVEQILESQRLKTISTQMKSARAENKSSVKGKRIDDEVNTLPSKRLFNDDDSDGDLGINKRLFGGIYKKRTSTRRRSSKRCKKGKRGNKTCKRRYKNGGRREKGKDKMGERKR